MSRAHDLIAPWPHRATYVSPRRHAREASVALRSRRRRVLGAVLIGLAAPVVLLGWMTVLHL